MICHPERSICYREAKANAQSMDPYYLHRTRPTPAARPPTPATLPQSPPTTAQSAHRGASPHPTATEPAAKSNIVPLQSTRREKSPPEQKTAAPPAAAPSPHVASPQTPPHPQTQTKNPAPPPDISPAARTLSSAAQAHAVG